MLDLVGKLAPMRAVPPTKSEMRALHVPVASLDGWAGLLLPESTRQWRWVVAPNQKQITFGELVGRCLAVLAVGVGIRVGVAVVCHPPLPPDTPAHTALKGQPKKHS